MSVALLRVGVDRVDVAIDVSVVEEVIDRPRYRPLPHAPVHLMGLASHRGAPLPLVDLAVLIGESSEVMSATDHDESLTASRVVVVALDDTQRAGFLVSHVRGVVSRHEAGARSAPLSDRLAPLVRCELLHDGAIVMELDPRALFEVARAR